jgi:hypothetical protein
MNPTHQQLSLLQAVAPPGAKVTVRAGHGVGKSGATSAAMWWMLECFDFPKVPCTAPSASQLRDVLWSELSKWSRASDEVSRRDGLPKELWLGSLFKITQDRVTANGGADEWFAVARTARKENPDALQGFHASDIVIGSDGRSVTSVGDGGQIFFVVEEASGVDDKIFEVAEGALSSHGARLLMVGNPTKNTGYFARSHKQDRADYTPLHFACSDSPLVDPAYRPLLVRKFGEGSNVVRVRADGEFPKQDDDVLIPLEHAEAALERQDVVAEGPRILGVDVARFGDDRTVFLIRQGRIIEDIIVCAKQDTMATAGQALALWQSRKIDAIHVDVVGLGAGVADRLRENKAPVVDVNVAEAAPERERGGVEAVPNKLRDFLWLEMSEWFRDAEPSLVKAPHDEAQDLAGEVSSVKYALNSLGKIVVEAKDAMKKRGLRSPDLADALGLTFAVPTGPKPIVISDEMLARFSSPVGRFASRMGRRR